MGAEETSRIFQLCAEVGHGKRRRVGSNQAVVGNVGLHFLENTHFYFEVFKYGFHDILTVFQFRIICAAFEVFQERLFFICIQNPSFNRFLQGFVNALFPFFQARFLNVNQGNIEPLHKEVLGDGRTHCPGPDYGDFVN